MKRDMDLLRDVLQRLEDRPAKDRGHHLDVPERAPEEVAYHLTLLVQAGYVTAVNASSNAGVAWLPLDLTMKGHDFLDAARNDTAWAKAKAVVREKGGSFTLDLLRDLLVKLAREALLGG